MGNSKSKTRKAFSQSGTSAKTEITAKPSENEMTGKFAFMLDRLDKKTPEEFKDDLIRIGIIDIDGKLMPHYQPQSKKKKSRE